MASKSKPLLWLQIFIAALAIAWLSYDFFHTVFNGVTYKLRFDDKLHYSQNAFAFFIAVGIKLAVYYFFIWLIRDCLKKLKG